MLVLAVKLDEEIPQALQQSHRGRGVVDEDAVPARPRQLALDDELAVREPVPGLVQQRGHRSRGLHFEQRLDHRRLFTAADQLGLSAGADDEQEGVHQDGLAGAGLPREHIEARRERQGHALGQLPVDGLGLHADDERPSPPIDPGGAVGDMVGRLGQVRAIDAQSD